MDLKIQFLNGGLANQAFQYIFARHFGLSHQGEVMFMDDSYFACNMVHNGYELEKVFGIRPHMLSEVFDEDVWQYIVGQRKNGVSAVQTLLDNGTEIGMITELTSYTDFNPFSGRVQLLKERGYKPQIQNVAGNVYYHGYWIDGGWFMQYQDVFRKEFTFPAIPDDANKRMADRILESRSLSIHIRRGDFLNMPIALDMQNYYGLIKMWIKGMGTDWDLYVFSDDMAWCRENREALGLDIFRTVTYVEGNTAQDSYIDMQLMSMCKGMIVSNSAFSYLAALLNKDKLAYISPIDREA